MRLVAEVLKPKLVVVSVELLVLSAELRSGSEVLRQYSGLPVVLVLVVLGPGIG